MYLPLNNTLWAPIDDKSAMITLMMTCILFDERLYKYLPYHHINAFVNAKCDDKVLNVDQVQF